MTSYKNIRKNWVNPAFGGTHADIIESQNSFLQLEYQRSESKSMCGFSIILIFPSNYDISKLKSPCFLLQKKM